MIMLSMTTSGRTITARVIAHCFRSALQTTPIGRNSSSAAAIINGLNDSESASLLSSNTARVQVSDGLDKKLSQLEQSLRRALRAISLVRTDTAAVAENDTITKLLLTKDRSKDKSVYQLLNSLLEANVDIRHVREVFELYVNNLAVKPTAVMAGPLVKHYILKDNYSEALNEFLRLADEYRITPWKSQLIMHFLENGDQSNLQKVIDVSDKIHGEMNTISDLAVICVELGKSKQAKRLLDTPGLSIKIAKIDTICERLVREEKLAILEETIRCFRNVFDANRDRMVYHLINGYINQQKPDKALDCWTLIQEEAIRPSDKTLLVLGNYLKDSGLTVPFEIPAKIQLTDDPIRSRFDYGKQQQQQTEVLNNSQKKFNIALQEGDIDTALTIKSELEAEGKSLLMSQNCSLIESFLNADRLDEAFSLSESLLSSKLFPMPRIIRFLFSKLSSAGDYQKLEQLEPILPEFILQHNSFTNSVAIAYINSGKIDELINGKFLQLKPFPLGGYLRALEVRPDVEEKLITIANALIREMDYHLPMNMVWINCMKSGRYDDAKRIYDSCPKFKDFLLFSSLLDTIRENNNTELAKQLIEMVSTSNLTQKTIGVVYSALIDAYIGTDQITEAEDVVFNQVINNNTTRIDPKSKQPEQLVTLQHLNRSTLNRLVKAIHVKENREPKFPSPAGRPLATSSYSTTTRNNTERRVDEDDSASSSDEEVLDAKSK
ncbi:leucine-rich PPR motif-containing protein, mitochondrial-like [Oppia nitens]|uniref:leucine-rich PPR motif-containing protein, mitochondrial-like n=1 Tax=Oppia nitens TaxID=1686743 RepID=UPI0023DAFBDC|nr:leucine-rich PPR motif-containing protein, mitochondrial-like [Oppia nitens]